MPHSRQVFLLVFFLFCTGIVFGQSNLTPYKPSGWDDRVVISTVTGDHQDSTVLESTDILYVDWAVINDGDTDITVDFSTALYVDDVLKGVWPSPSSSGLDAGVYSFASDTSIGTLSTGSHTIRLKTDLDDVVSEADETDNEYIKIITIGPGIPDIRVEPTTLTYSEAEEDPAASASEPMYSQLSAPTKARDWRILMRTGSFEPNPVEKSVNLAMARKASESGESAHLLVQFNEKLSRLDRRELNAQGIRILRYVPNNAYWIATTAEARARFSSITQGGGIRWSSPSRWIDKLSPEARAGRFPSHARLNENRVAVQVLAFKDMDWTQIQDAVEAAGGQVLSWTHDHLLKISIEESNLETLAALDIIEWVEAAPGPPVANNVVSAERIRVDEIKSTPYSLDGTGVMVGVWDGGPIDFHTDFDTRLTVVDSGTANDHATHVGGTIAGSGAGNASATGMAPAAELWSYEWTYPTTEMSSAYDSGVRLANHSWGYVTGWHEGEDTGSENFGAYTSNSNDWDDLVHTTGMIVFKSAGNDRNDGPDYDEGGPRIDGPYDCIGQIASSKNIITIGATNDDDTMTSFSSWGPVDDGRIKPDLCANGSGLLSTLPGNSYGSYSGTSMSTPSATGAGALIHELNTQVTGQDLRADTCKAILIHSAVDLGRTGPDYEFGWGLIDARVGVDLLSAQNYQLGAVPDSGSETYTVSVPADATSLKATLVWTDPPGSPAASVALINDLDLVVTSPSAAITRPWILDKDNPTNNATRAVNSIDNVEQVLVDTPESGDWSIEVQGTSVPEGTVQNYTLVCEYLSASGIPQSFTIYNDGTGILSVDPLALESAAAWISWSPTGTVSIPAGSSATVTVIVDLDNAPAGTTSRRLLITSDDPDESPYPAAVNIVTERLPEVEPVNSVTGTMTTGMTLQWDCEEGYTYQLQYSDTLDPVSWTDIGPLQTPTVGQTIMSYSDTTTTSSTGKRFYRIERLPAE